MSRYRSLAIFLPLALLVCVATVWASLALWYRLPLPQYGRATVGGFLALFGLFTIFTLIGRRQFKTMLIFALVFVGLLFWWNSIKPMSDADWSPDVSRQVTGKIEGDTLTLTEVRNFEWRSNIDFSEKWETRSYDLSKLQTLDLFMSYWSGPTIAHVIFSFGFEGGEQLAWSIEVRRRVGGEFSPLADLFKSNALVIVAADERDVVGVRSNIRNEDVQIYRLKVSPQQARLLLTEYVADANRLATTPQFYNSLTTNCTTAVVKMIRVAGDNLPFDWRLIVNGHLPEYAYDRGALDTSVPLSQLRAIAHIDQRARADGRSPNFSKAIRAGVPSPNAPGAP